MFSDSSNNIPIKLSCRSTQGYKTIAENFTRNNFFFKYLSFEKRNDHEDL